MPDLEPALGNRIEPRQEDAGGKGAVEHHMGQQYARKAIGGALELDAEQRIGDLVDPAIAPPDGEEPEGHHHARRHDGRGKQAHDQVAPGEAQPVERPGDGDADREGQHGCEARLQRRHPQQMRNVDA